MTLVALLTMLRSIEGGANVVRLDVLVRQVLADARERMDEGKAGREISKLPASKVARREEAARGNELGCGGVAAPPTLHQRGSLTRDTRRPSGGLGK